MPTDTNVTTNAPANTKPRNRYKFTREDCRKGFQAAEASLEARFPGQGHFLICALIGCKPALTFYPDREEVAGLTDEQIAARYVRED